MEAEKEMVPPCSLLPAPEMRQYTSSSEQGTDEFLKCALELKIMEDR